MPEFQKDIIDLDELNRKVDANKQRKNKAHKRRARWLLLLQSILFALTVLSLMLGDARILSFPVAIACAALATFAGCFVAGYHFGYSRCA